MPAVSPANSAPSNPVSPAPPPASGTPAPVLDAAPHSVTASAGERSSSRPVWIAAILLLLIFAGLAAHPAFTTSATFDEPDHVGVGYASLQTARHPFANVNLRLSQMWAALPLLALDPAPTMPTLEAIRIGEGAGINFGRQFFYSAPNDTEAIVAASRTMIIVLGLTLGALLFGYARKLHGDAAGLLTLALYCFSPLIISNSAVATSDIATTLLFTCSVLALWRLMHRITIPWILLTGLSVGALAATKISGLLIVPMAVLLLLLRRWNGRPLEVKLSRRPGRFGTARFLPLLGSLLASAVVAWLVVWAIYGGPAGAPQSPLPEWDSNFHDTHFSTTTIQRLREWRLLPEDYLHDLHRFVLSGSKRRAFLMGQYSINGWWQFFPIAWLVKNPLTFHLALLVGFLVLVRSFSAKSANPFRAHLHGLAPLFVLALVYGIVALRGNLNIGARHLLPVYPFALLIAGLAVHSIWRSIRLRTALLAVLVSGAALEAALIHPQHLAYFNVFAGGPKYGWRILTDSSSDWGESLPQVRDWLAKRRASGDTRRIYFSYFGCADLTHFGLTPDTAVLLPQFYDARPIEPYPLGPGAYVLSTTMLNSLYDGNFFGPWRASHEKRYRELVTEAARFHAVMNQPEALQALIEREGFVNWAATMADFDFLRFNRLCAYLRQREPDERITYGTVVYHLEVDDLQTALAGPPPEMAPDDVIKGAADEPDNGIDFLR